MCGLGTVCPPRPQPGRGEEPAPRSGGRAEGEHPLREQHSSAQGSAVVLQPLLGLPGGALRAGSAH